MATATDEQKAAKEAEREAAAKAKEAERKAKEEERAAAKAEKEKQKAEERAKKEQEKIDKILSDGGVDRKDVKGTGDNGAILVKDAREAVKAKRAEERANRPKKAPLTLSQRRAVLVLAEQGEVVPRTAFNALPLDHLVGVGLAEKFDTKKDEEYTESVDKEVDIPKDEQTEGGPTTKTVKDKVTKTRTVDATGYRLTDQGRERAGEINPKWKTWKPDRGESSNGGDASASKQTAGSAS